MGARDHYEMHNVLANLKPLESILTKIQGEGAGYCQPEVPVGAVFSLCCPSTVNRRFTNQPPMIYPSVPVITPPNTSAM